MSREEAQGVLDEQPGGSADLNGMMRVIEAMLAVNNPNVSPGEIDRRVATIRQTFLGQS